MRPTAEPARIVRTYCKHDNHHRTQLEARVVDRLLESTSKFFCNLEELLIAPLDLARVLTCTISCGSK